MLVITVSLVVLLLLRVPIGFSLMLSSFAYILTSDYQLPWPSLPSGLNRVWIYSPCWPYPFLF